MTLLNAGLLVAGLCAAVIPILIHLLFRRRRPPIAWAAMEILQAALRKQERRLRLEQLTLLAVRCLLFAVVGLALARPVLESTGLLRGTATRVVTVVLDDSVVGDVRPAGDDVTSFAALRARAAAAVRDLPAGDAVALITASAPARGIVLPPSTDREAVARTIESLDASRSRADIAAGLRLASDAVAAESAADHLVLVFSEFRSGGLDLASAKPAPLAAAGAGRRAEIAASAPATEDITDVAIVAVEPQRSVDDDSVTVGVRLERGGGALGARTVTVAVTGDGTAAVPPKSVRFEPGQATARAEFVLRPSADALRRGTGAIVASVEPDAMPANDRFAAIFDARSATRIGIVARRSFGGGGELEQVPASRWLERALAPTEQAGIEVVEVEPAAVDQRSLGDLEVLFLPRPESLDAAAWPALRGFVDRGGLLVAMPSSETDAQRWVEKFAAAFQLGWTIATDAPRLPAPLGFAPEQSAGLTFAAVEAELPELLRPIEVERRLEVSGAAAGDVVLRLADGSPFLLLTSPPAGSGRSSRGLVAFVTAAPELGWTNLPVKPFIVPFAQELVRSARAAIGGADRATVGDRPAVAARDAAELLPPEGASSATPIPVADGLAAAPALSDGVWVAADARGGTVGGVAVNVDRRATTLLPQSAAAVEEWLGAAGPVTFAAPGGPIVVAGAGGDSVASSLWLLALAVVLAAIESLLARSFSHAAIRGRGSADVGVLSTSARARDGSSGGLAA